MSGDSCSATRHVSAVDGAHLAALSYRSLPAGTRIAEPGYDSILLSTGVSLSSQKTAERYRIGDRIGDRYEVVAIHHGGMGVVYGTFDHETKLPRALKTLQSRWASDESMRRLFAAEAAAWVRLEKHPFIVRAFVVEKFDEQPYVITEYVRGGRGMGNDLRGWLGHPRLTPPVAIEVALQIAQAMQHATRKVPGVVHRDLKPANVLIDDRGQARVTDFGLVYAADATAGTPAYMAPEQWLDNKMSQRTDIYAFGCILYEMFTGHRMFAARTLEAWKVAHIGQMPTSMLLLQEDLPAELDQFVFRCLSKYAEARPQTWDEIVEQCAGWFQRLTGQRPVLDFSAYQLTARELITASYSLSQLGKYEEILPLCDRVLAADPKSTVAYNYKGYALSHLGRSDEALAAYERATLLNPRDRYACDAKASLLRKLGRPKEALKAYERLIDIEPDNGWAWIYKAESLEKLGRWEETLQAAERGIVLVPNDGHGWSHKGAALDRLGRTDDALAAYNQVLAVGHKNCPLYREAFIQKAAALEKLGRWDETLEAANAAVKKNPKDQRAWMLQGRALDRLRRTEEALSAYEKAVAIDPTCHEGWIRKAGMLEALERWEAAEIAYDSALRLQPGDEHTWNRKGLMLYRLGRHEQALADFDRALAIAPAHVLAWTNKALALQALGRGYAALSAYDRPLEVAPDLEVARQNRDSLRGRMPWPGFQLLSGASRPRYGFWNVFRLGKRDAKKRNEQ
jgi:tetratricopeptide (TPR) repeat protein